VIIRLNEINVIQRHRRDFFLQLPSGSQSLISFTIGPMSVFSTKLY